MKNSLTLIVAAVAASLWGEPAPGKTPNIVMVLADDLGYGDVHCLNLEHGKIATPHTDRLAAQGMVFTDAHSGSSVCTPTRYGILTGRYAWRTRLQSSALLPYDPPLIAADRLTLPKLLANHGYETACIGKWHLGWNWPRDGQKVLFDHPIADGPTTRGFGYYFGTDVPNYPPYSFIKNDRLVARPTEWFKGDHEMVLYVPGPIAPGWQFDRILPTLAEQVVQYIGERAADKKPFFLYFALTSPHEPIAPSTAFRGKSGISPLADFIMETDWALGQVLSALEKQGLAEDTLVFFVSDNGHATYNDLKSLLDAGHRPSQRFRGYKSDIWEGGHRIPFLARWPGVIKAGATCDQLICLTDLMATCAELVGAQLPGNAGEDSVSLLPILKGAATGSRHEAVMHHSGSGKFSIRKGKWKLVLCPGSGGIQALPNPSPPTDAEAVKLGLPVVQLYDMSHDDTEQVNVVEKHPEIVHRLTALLERYVNDGRSTLGAPQKNDVKVDIRKAEVK